MLKLPAMAVTVTIVQLTASEQLSDISDVLHHAWHPNMLEREIFVWNMADVAIILFKWRLSPQCTVYFCFWMYENHWQFADTAADIIVLCDIPSAL